MLQKVHTSPIFQGSCFPQSFGGSCSGTPSECQDCNNAINCQHLEGCDQNGPLQWQDNAHEFVEFTSVEDRFGRVNTTMWVLPKAFRCAQTLNDLKNISVFISKEVEEKSEADGGKIIINNNNEAENIISSPVYVGNKNETKTESPSKENPNSNNKTSYSSPTRKAHNSLKVVNISLYRWR